MKYLSTKIYTSQVKGVNMLAPPPYPNSGLSAVLRGHSSSKMPETIGGISVLMISSVSQGDPERALTEKLQG